MSDLVSIVIPVRDGERYLAEAIESALGQDHRPIEVIVVDDGSTDASATIAEGYAEVTTLRRPPRNPAAARNTGVAASAGGFVTFLDADDIMGPGKVSRQLEYLRRHPKAGCVLCREEVFLEEGVEKPNWLVPDRFFGDPGGLQPSAAMVPADVARRFPFDESMPLAEDVDWLFRMRADEVRIHVLPEVLMRRRIHGANLTYRIRESDEWIMRSLARRIAERRAEGG